MRVRHRIECEIRRVNHGSDPLSGPQVLEALQTFGPFHTQGLNADSSLSACGYIRGGPATVIEVLRTWIRERDLVMPTHTYCYPDKDGGATRSIPPSRRVGLERLRMLSGGSRTLCVACIRPTRWPVWVLGRRGCVRDMNYATRPVVLVRPTRGWSRRSSAS